MQRVVPRWIHYNARGQSQVTNSVALAMNAREPQAAAGFTSASPKGSAEISCSVTASRAGGVSHTHVYYAHVVSADRHTTSADSTSSIVHTPGLAD